METNEAIKFLKNEIYIFTRNPDDVLNKEEIKFIGCLDEIITLLKQGEKFEKMWENVLDLTENYIYDHSITYKDLIHLQQKYFPKPKKELVELKEKMDKEVEELLKWC